MNAIKLLMQDHKKIRQLLSELEGTTTRNVRDRERLVREISTEVNAHAKVEEEIFYPAFKEAAKKTDDTDMFYEAAEEHHVVEMVLPELEAADPASDEFTAKAKVLKELIEHHAGEEEKEMFKRAKALMDEDELEDLGTRLEERKMELLGEEPELVGAGASSARNGATAARGNGAKPGRAAASARPTAPKTPSRPTTRAASTGRGTTSRKRK